VIWSHTKTPVTLTHPRLYCFTQSTSRRQTDKTASDSRKAMLLEILHTHFIARTVAARDGPHANRGRALLSTARTFRSGNALVRRSQGGVDLARNSPQACASSGLHHRQSSVPRVIDAQTAYPPRRLDRCARRTEGRLSRSSLASSGRIPHASTCEGSHINITNALA
jgi:hypothetical protein